MALLGSIQVEIAKKRIKHHEYLAFIEAGREISPHQLKANKLREKYGLQNWDYERDY